MRSIVFGFGLVVLTAGSAAGLGASAGAAESASSPGEPQAGTELYGEFCSRCHGENKEGLANFSGDFADFAQRLEGMTENMPDFAGFFEEQEVLDLYAYLSVDGATAPAEGDDK